MDPKGGRDGGKSGCGGESKKSGAVGRGMSEVSARKKNTHVRGTHLFGHCLFLRGLGLTVIGRGGAGV